MDIYSRYKLKSIRFMGRETTLLNPIVAKKEIDTFNSKMSGKPNTNHMLTDKV